MNKSKPLVTIGIPTFNRADSYLKIALESAVKQTYPNIEIVVSDNCSIDNTETVVKGFNDSRIRYFKQKENIGPYKNFNFCLQQANGDFFLILSDDDLIDNDFIDVCMKAANYSTDIGIIRTGTRGIDAQGKVLYESFNKVGGLSFEEFLRGWFSIPDKTALFPCSTLFNTKKLKEIGGFKPENNLFHDGFVVVQLAAKFDRIDVEDIKASFRIHPDEITFSVKIKDWCEDSLLLLNLICDLASDEYKKTVRKEGLQYFSRVNYNHARAVRSPIRRYIAYIHVFKTFHYKFLPPPLTDFLISFLKRTPLNSPLRFIKKKIM